MEIEHEGHEGHEGHEEERPTGLLEDTAAALVDAAFKVHKVLGPGLLESTYEQCLAHELQLRGIACRRQVALPVIYEGMRLDADYRLDLVVENAVIAEIKSTETLTRLHEAQILTYLKLSRYRIGFLMNFNVDLFKNGLKRFKI